MNASSLDAMDGVGDYCTCAHCHKGFDAYRNKEGFVEMIWCKSCVKDNDFLCVMLKSAVS